MVAALLAARLALICYELCDMIVLVIARGSEAEQDWKSRGRYLLMPEMFFFF